MTVIAAMLVASFGFLVGWVTRVRMEPESLRQMRDDRDRADTERDEAYRELIRRSTSRARFF
jgi:hypothetical protein